jgi:hypothetical protein
MADLWVVLTLVGFFAMCVGFVWGCDRIIGPDEESELAEDVEATDSEAELAEVTR